MRRESRESLILGIFPTKIKRKTPQNQADEGLARASSQSP
jgi:hypothetical protein